MCFALLYFGLPLICLALLCFGHIEWIKASERNKEIGKDCVDAIFSGINHHDEKSASFLWLRNTHHFSFDLDVVHILVRPSSFNAMPQHMGVGKQSVELQKDPQLYSLCEHVSMCLSAIMQIDIKIDRANFRMRSHLLSAEGFTSPLIIMLIDLRHSSEICKISNWFESQPKLSDKLIELLVDLNGSVIFALVLSTHHVHYSKKRLCER